MDVAESEISFEWSGVDYFKSVARRPVNLSTGTARREKTYPVADCVNKLSSCV